MTSVISSVLSDQYTPLSPLGEGTFASVVKAKENSSEEVVAIKQIYCQPLEKDQYFEEVIKLRELKNDHIIKFKTAFYDFSEKYLNVVMELCKCSLRSQLNQNKKYTKMELKKFISQMVSAFLELNGHNVMHLDLKPENILIANDAGNLYKICDFGCSQIAQKSRFSGYVSNVFGTFNYLAPQIHIQGENTDGKKSKSSADIWSLGVILYELMYKKLPFPVEKNGNISREGVQKFCQGKYDIVFQKSDQNYGQIQGLINKMLLPKPYKRITWKQLKQELIQNHNVQEFHFMQIRDINYKHLMVLNLFISEYIIIKKNLDFSKNPFYKDNKTELQQLRDNILHLSYIYSLKFNYCFGYKMKNILTAKQIEDIDCIHTNIQYEQYKLIKSTKSKISTLNQINYVELKITQASSEIYAVISQIDKDNIWQSMKDILVFCKEINKYSNSSFFISSEFFAESIDSLKIVIQD